MSAHHLAGVLSHVRRLFGDRSDEIADGTLLERFARHADDAAFATLVRRHGPLVWSVSRRVAEHEQDAEDVYQATFLLLARKAGSIRKRNSVGSWLYGVAYRLALRARCDAARRRQREAQAAGSPTTTACDNLTWRELRETLDAELARLPENYRAPLLLCYFEGLTQEEAARQLGWSKRSVKDRLKRGRNRLRVRLARRGMTLSMTLAGSLLAGDSSKAAAPVALSELTLRGAVAFARHRPLAGLVSQSVIDLTERGLKAMFVSKLLIATTLVLVAATLGGAGVFLSQAGPQTKPETAAQVQPGEKDRIDRSGDPLPAGAVARLGTVRFRHGSNMTHGLSFLPDSSTIALATELKIVQFWEARTGRLLREFRTDPVSVRGFAISRDGKLIAVGGFLPYEKDGPTRGAVQIMNANTGKEVRTLPRNDRDVDHCSMAFTPDSKLLASVGDSGVLRIEEIASGVEILRHKIPADILSKLAFAPDGATLAISSGPNTHKLYLWKWQSGEEPRQLKVPPYAGGILVFSPDGQRLAECGEVGETVRVWDVRSGRLVHNLEPPGADRYGHRYLAFSPDGKTLAASGYRRNWHGVVHLWNPETGEFRGGLSAGGTGAGWVAISADSKLLAVSTDRAIKVWDLATHKELAADDKSHQGHVSNVAITANGQVATASDDHTVRVWEMNTGRQLLKLSQDSWVRAVALSPNGSLLAASSLDDTVRLWDLKTERELYRLPGHGEQGGRRLLAFTDDGKRFLSWGDDYYLRIWDVATGKAVHEHRIRPPGMNVPDEDAEPDARFRPGFQPGAAAVSADGKLFVLAYGVTVFVFDVATGKEVRALKTESRGLEPLALSPDGKLLLAGGDGEQIKTPLPDGRVRYSLAEEHPLDLWDLSSGEKLRRIVLPGGTSGPIAFSADGKTFAAATERLECKIRIWDVATGAEGPAISCPGRVTTLAFAPDATRLVTAMADTSVLVWDLTAVKH